MSTEKKIDATYELILNTARNLLFKEGKFNATTQEIADTAGVNRTLINYYFRSRDALFELVLNEAKNEEYKKKELIITSDLPLKDKLIQFMDYFYEMAKIYPYKEIYIVTQMNQHDLCNLESSSRIKKSTEKFYKVLEEEMEKGNIVKMDPLQFLLNFISLVSFPVSMRPLLQQGLDISDKEFDKIISERKESILKILFLK